MPSQEVLGLHPTDLIPHTAKNYWSKFQQTHCFPRFAVQFITRFAVLFPRFLEFETPAQYLAIGFKGTGRHRKGRFFAPLFDYAFGPSTSVDPWKGYPYQETLRVIHKNQAYLFYTHYSIKLTGAYTNTVTVGCHKVFSSCCTLA